MGLEAKFSVMNLGFPLYTPVLHLPIDYEEGLKVFCETFINVATDLVPVDTGTLMNSINADYDTADWSVTCSATMYYAQYVEYGTYKMDAQPFFNPAINEACIKAIALWQNALDETLAIEQEELEVQFESQGGGDSSMFSISELFGVLFAMLIIAIIQVLISTMTNGKMGSSPQKAANLITTTITNDDGNRFGRKKLNGRNKN